MKTVDNCGKRSKVTLVLLAHAAAHGEAEEDREAPSPAEASAEQQGESLPPPCTGCFFHLQPAPPGNPGPLCFSVVKMNFLLKVLHNIHLQLTVAGQIRVSPWEMILNRERSRRQRTGQCSFGADVTMTAMMWNIQHVLCIGVLKKKKILQPLWKRYCEEREGQDVNPSVNASLEHS